MPSEYVRPAVSDALFAEEYSSKGPFENPFHKDGHTELLHTRCMEWSLIQFWTIHDGWRKNTCQQGRSRARDYAGVPITILWHHIQTRIDQSTSKLCGLNFFFAASYVFAFCYVWNAALHTREKQSCVIHPPTHPPKHECYYRWNSLPSVPSTGWFSNLYFFLISPPDN